MDGGYHFDFGVSVCCIAIIVIFLTTEGVFSALELLVLDDFWRKDTAKKRQNGQLVNNYWQERFVF